MAFPKIVAFLLAGALSLPTPVFPQIKQSKPEDPCWDYLNNYWLGGGFIIGFGTMFLSRQSRKVGRRQPRGEGGRFTSGSILLGPGEIVGYAFMLGAFAVSGVRWIHCVWNKSEE